MEQQDVWLLTGLHTYRVRYNNCIIDGVLRAHGSLLQKVLHSNLASSWQGADLVSIL